jgi:hypothetical protein
MAGGAKIRGERDRLGRVTRLSGHGRQYESQRGDTTEMMHCHEHSYRKYNV